MKQQIFYAFVASMSLASVQGVDLSIITEDNEQIERISLHHEQIISFAKGKYRLIFDRLQNCNSLSPVARMPFKSQVSIDCEHNHFSLNIFVAGDYKVDFIDHKFSLIKKAQAVEIVSKVPTIPTPKYHLDHNGFATIKLDNDFAHGLELCEIFTEQRVRVNNGYLSFIPSRESGGLALFEICGKKSEKNDRSQIVYFVLIDRFFNGDPSNDNAYGRLKDGLDEVGTFHGGDLKGLTQKLDYIASLGTTMLWISPLVEQIHGFVEGNKGAFPFYGYHGYWAKDFTKIDQSFGSEDDLKDLIDKAHSLGMKVIVDVVLNHAGYPTLIDMQKSGIDVIKNGRLDVQSPNWHAWWGADWVRGDFDGFLKPGGSDETMSLANLPDFITESRKKVTPPQWLLANPHTKVQAIENFTVKDYLIKWQSDWVGDFGFDGFRLDTVKHITSDMWQDLKVQAQQKLNKWREKRGLTPQNFYLLGEVWGQGIDGGFYASTGFDSLINFDFQHRALLGAQSLEKIDGLFDSYAQALENNPTFTPLSYLSSHDTELFFNRYRSIDLQKRAANALMLLPGNVQIYYGDEVARAFGKTVGDLHQGTRSDMIFSLDDERKKLLSHWQKLGNFRKEHSALALGKHKRILQPTGEYVFKRTLGDDKILAVFADFQ